jgi:hypothetical protein
MPSVTEIREAYWNPCRICFRGSQGYCVGGAICLAHGLEMYFPDETYLEQVLHKLNPALDTTTAHQYSKLIIMYNDRGEFEKAWGVAEQALTTR